MSELPPHLGAQLDGLDVQVRRLTAHVEELRIRLDQDEPAAPADGHGNGGGNGFASPGKPVFATGSEWATAFLLPTFVRPIGGHIRWCQQWGDHVEAVLRLEAMWRAWEVLRADPGTGMSEYLLHHLDPGLAALTATTGPFARCTPDRHVPPARDQPHHTALSF